VGNIEDTATGGDDAIASRERLIDRVVEQIRRQGYFLAHLDPQPMQEIIDVRWAAQMAGRAIGRQVRTYASSVGATQPQKVTVVVAATEACSPSDIRARDRARMVIEDLLMVQSALPRPRGILT
jgi:hypothetical protein